MDLEKRTVASLRKVPCVWHRRYFEERARASLDKGMKQYHGRLLVGVIACTFWLLETAHSLFYTNICRYLSRCKAELVDSPFVRILSFEAKIVPIDDSIYFALEYN